jgi:hypothetical protein
VSDLAPLMAIAFISGLVMPTFIFGPAQKL